MIGCCNRRSCARSSRGSAYNRSPTFSCERSAIIGRSARCCRRMPVPPNSDFFPFVDLNAPRLRYMRENAIELPALTVLPIPFLELLDGAAPRGPTARARREQRTVSGSSGATGSRNSPCRIEWQPRRSGSAQRDIPVAHRHESGAVCRRRQRRMPGKTRYGTSATIRRRI